MKGLFIPGITAEMFRNGCLESIEALMAEGEIYDIDYEPKRKGMWIDEGQYAEGHSEHAYYCSQCEEHYIGWIGEFNFCPNCGARMIQPCEECKHYDDIDCRFCRGEYIDRWEAKE